jgi:putative FmdB family regulatory protein
MPLYEYRCESCGHRFEVIQKFSDSPVSVCPNCGKGPVVKLMSSPAIQFKGSGFYITDYARKDSGKSSGSGSSSDSSGTNSSSSSSDSTATPAKTETSTPKSDSKTPKSDSKS